MDTDTTSAKTAEAESLVNNYMAWSAGAGLIPIPGLDLATIGLVQLKMLDDLSRIYAIPFSKNIAKSVIGALCGSAGSVAVAFPAASLIKIVPLVGPLASMFTEPAAAAAATYALGRVFIMHFESGGSFLDFDPNKVRKYFDEHRSNAPAKPVTTTTTAAKPA